MHHLWRHVYSIFEGMFTQCLNICLYKRVEHVSNYSNMYKIGIKWSKIWDVLKIMDMFLQLVHLFCVCKKVRNYQITWNWKEYQNVLNKSWLYINLHTYAQILCLLIEMVCSSFRLSWFSLGYVNPNKFSFI